MGDARTYEFVEFVLVQAKTTKDFGTPVEQLLTAGMQTRCRECHARQYLKKFSIVVCPRGRAQCDGILTERVALLQKVEDTLPFQVQRCTHFTKKTAQGSGVCAFISVEGGEL